MKTPIPTSDKGPQKKAVTLLELLLVMAVIAMVGGICALQIPKALHLETFSQSVERLIDKLELAQELMLDYDTSVTLKLNCQEKGLECVFEGAGVPPKILEKMNNDPFLKGITAFIWQGVPQTSHPFCFKGSEYECPKGILTLKGNREVSLFLPGHPGKIEKNSQKLLIGEILPPYPQEVIQ